MKKLLLGLGTVVATVAPVASVIACGDDAQAPTPTIAAPSARVYNADTKEAIIKQSEILRAINAITLKDTAPTSAQLTNQLDATVANTVAQSWFGPGGVAAKYTDQQAKTHDYEKFGSSLDGQFLNSMFENGPKGWPEFKFVSEITGQKILEVSAYLITAINHIATNNNVAKLGATLTGTAIDHQRGHQVNKTELLALLKKFKELAPTIATQLDAAITKVNAMSDF